MPTLRLHLPRCELPFQAHADPLGRQELHVYRMWLCDEVEALLECSHAEAHGRSQVLGSLLLTI